MESQKLGMKTVDKDLKNAVCRDGRLQWISIQTQAVGVSCLLRLGGRRERQN
jgi:hypothetical protein